MNRLIALLALAVLVGFLGILLVSVPRLDLGLVIALTVALAAIDFARSAFMSSKD